MKRAASTSSSLRHSLRRVGPDSFESSAARDGPISLEQVLNVPISNVLTLISVMDSQQLEAFTKRVNKLCSRGLLLTSSYSGTGGFESTAVHILQELCKSLALPPLPVVVYSAKDMEPSSRRVLKNHRAAHAPLHVFGDIRDAIPLPVREKLLNAEARFLRLWQETKDEKRQGCITERNSKQWQDDLTNDYLEAIHEFLQEVEFRDIAWCYVHHKECPLNPRHDESLRDMLWIECSGSTCCPWSRGGGHDHYLDKATLVFFTWLYHMRFMQPDLLLHENVEGFPVDILADILNKGVASQLKCLFSRVPADFEKDCGSTDFHECQEQWVVESVVFSPDDIGIPSNRVRRYACARWAPFVGRCDSRPSFESVYFARRKCNASVYFAFDMSHCTPADGKDDEEYGHLCMGDAARIEGHQLQAFKHGFCDATLTTWNVPFALVDITKSETYVTKAMVDKVPTLMRRTKLWDLVADAGCPVAMHWLIQGFPHPMARGVSDATKARFPFPALLERRSGPASSTDDGDIEALTPCEQRSLTGNAMHIAQVGSWFLHVLSGIDID